MNPVQEPISISREIGGRELTIETGRIARQAHGSVTVTYGETTVFAAVTTGDPRPGIDFFPLTVDYREVYAAAGKIPGGFFKREGRPTQKEILTCRLIDRPVRPLFPKGFKDDVMIQCRVFAADGQNDSDVPTMIAASAALAISCLPWEGPIGATRIGRVGTEGFIVNPVEVERESGELDLVVASTRDAVCMVEAGANELSESDMIDAIFLGHETNQKLIAMIDELVEKCGTKKMAFTAPEADTEAAELVAPARKAMDKANLVEGKHARKIALKEARDAHIEKVIADRKLDDEDEIKALTKRLKSAWADLEKVVVRESILKNGKRADGRTPTDIRPIHVDAGPYPRSHGSCLFTRGETQAVVEATLGTRQDEQRIEGLGEQWWNRFMLHYNFPSYCVGETWPNRGPKRREIGHGALAERALRPILPDFEKFPYTLRIVSEITESNGSSSMATVCGGTLALMDAGVSIRRPVAGIAMGLIKEGGDVAVLSDILGLEDACGDMDFKVAGTQRGITALQMDIKIKGLERSIMETALAQAKEGRFHILKVMLGALAAPRPSISPFAPKIVTLPIESDKIGALIGPGGKTIRRIQEENKVKIDIDDDKGTVTIAGGAEAKLDEAVGIVRDLTRDVAIGEVYDGTVMAVKDFGAFVEILPGKEGLLHVEELGIKEKGGPRINMNDHLKPGDKVTVKVIDIDPLGRIRLSKRAVKEEETANAGA